MRSRHVLFIVGVVAGVLVPVARLIYRAFESRHAWWMTWLGKEFHQQAPVYVCLALFAVLIFSVAGFLLGQALDQRVDEAESALESNLELSEKASTDPLTRLFNARAIHEMLDIEMENSARSQLTCLLIDIDHFKHINDTYGHPAGDAVLTRIARVLKRSVRPTDGVGRLGGEEFIIVLPATTLQNSTVVGERVRRNVEAEAFSFEGKSIRVTVSIGAAAAPAPGLSGKESLLKAADEALYQAKHAGRNRLILWDKAA